MNDPARIRSFEIASRAIGPGHPCLIVGEVAQTHDGSLGLAHAFVDAIADTGADAVKFQTHIAEAESTPSEPFRVRFSWADATRYEYWRRTSFREDEWLGLAEHASGRGLLFLSSPFSEEAADLLERVGVPAWKIGSGEVTNARLLDRVARTGKPVLLSSGLSSLADLDTATSRLRSLGAPFAILQATTEYPCPPERVGLNLLELFRERYSSPVGLSDHTGTIFSSLAAVTLGADVVEVHVTLSREMFGPDVAASVTTEELAELVRGARAVETMLANPVSKDEMAEDLLSMRSLFTKSVVARRDLPAGTLLDEGHFALKKPGTGLPAERLEDLVGRRLLRDVRADELLSEDDVE